MKKIISILMPILAIFFLVGGTYYYLTSENKNFKEEHSKYISLINDSHDFNSGLKGLETLTTEKAKETTPKQDKSKSKVQSGWVGNYYVKSDGKRAKNEWVDGGRYYVDSDGKKVKSDWIYDKKHGSYYYLTAEGSSARNKWVGNYYLKSDGKMAKNEWVDGGRYYVGSDGEMVRGKWVDGGRHYVGYDGVRQPKPADGNQYNAALEKAKSYNSWANMSKKALYEQLTWHGFSSSAVQYAIDHLNADYKANALAKAREYRKYSNLSKTEIYERLTSPYFRKFTKEEANYAIQKLGDK